MHVIDRHPLRSAAHARAAVRRADLPRELRRERLADAPGRIERARDGDAPPIDEREHRVGRRTLRLEHARELAGVDRHLEHVAQLARTHHGEVEANARPARHERDEKIGDHRRAALEHVFHRVAAAERHLRVALVGAGRPRAGQRIGQHRAVGPAGIDERLARRVEQHDKGLRTIAHGAHADLVETREVATIEERRAGERLQHRERCLHLAVDRERQGAHRVLHAAIHDLAALREVLAHDDHGKEQ